MSRLYELFEKDTKCVHDCKLDGVSWSRDNYCMPGVGGQRASMEKGMGTG